MGFAMKKSAAFALLLALAAPSFAFAQAPTRAELARVDRILRNTPLIDGHNDLPWAIKSDHHNDLASVDLNGDTRTLTPHPRNVPDDVLELVRANGGVVMVNFFPMFTSTEVRQWAARRAAEEARLKALNPANPAVVTAGVATWVEANPRPAIDVGVIADHIEHIASVASRDNVGIGSDFDGVPWLPEGLDGVEDYPNLFVELMRRGWSDRDLAKLAGGNLLCALRQAERVAAES